MKKTVLAVLCASVALPLITLAQVAVPTAVQANFDQLKTINQQITALQQTRATILSQITQSLKQGSRGDQVKILQALLASDASIYPEASITGYYGAMTAKAVKRFQQKHGIDPVGSIGPKTRNKLNELLGDTPIVFGTASTTSTSTVYTHREREDDNDQGDRRERKDARPCVIVPPGHLIAPGWLRKHKEEDRPIVPPCQILPPGISDRLNGQPSSTTTPPVVIDTTAPVLSSIAVSATTTSATVTWNTNEAATSNVYFSISTPVNLASSTAVRDAGLLTSHSLSLTGLTASTTYYYLVNSFDASKNAATSTEQSFVTTH